MATPPENDDANHSNAPLNFRHSNSLITTKVPHYPTKLTTGMTIIPGWNRPNANGQNANINDKDYNGPNFKARPLKHWRKQLQVYNYNGPANNSRTATISELDRPGTTVYHFTPDCTCVPDEGGNSYIISNNKFGYETKDDDYSKGVLDVKVQNNGFTVVPYDATTAQINDPTNQSAYKIMTGIYNTNCINCSPQGNIIRSGIAFQSQAFFSYSNDKLETRCQTYEQNISTNKEPGCVYFDAQGIPLWPTDTRNGPQVVAPVNYQPTRLFNKPCLSETIYKPSNVAFAKQGAVSGATRLRKLVSDTTMMNGSSFYSARGAEEANLGRYQGTNLSSNYYVKTKPVVDSCRGTIPTPPIISIVDRDAYNITLTWQDFGNSICNVVYYNVTYFAINIIGPIEGTLRNVDDSGDFFNSSEGVENFLDNYNEIEFYNIDNTETMVMGTKNSGVDSNTVYTNSEHNIQYTIASEIITRMVIMGEVPNTSIINHLSANTYYLMSSTSTNGNGTSIESNAVLGTTLPESNIVISIDPLTIESGDNYVYPYNASEPIDLRVKVSSLHTMTPIILSIINATNSNVATIIPVRDSPDTYDVKLKNAGTFNLEATQARVDDEFGNSKKISPLLTISQATPIFSTPWNISRSNVLLIGILIEKTYPFFPLNIISSIQLDGQYKIINVDGTESNIATFINTDKVESNTANFGDNFGEYGTKILVKSYGKFRVKATSIETQNYKSISTTSDNIYVSRNDPIIEFKFPDAESFIRKFTYRTGQIYDIEEINPATIISPEEPQSDVHITYSAILPETEIISDVASDVRSDVASIDARTVTILNAGSFRIRAQTNQTDVYNSIYIDSPPVTIDKATPIFAGPWYLFQDIDTVLFVGRTYTFNPPVFEYPYPGPSFPSASISITSYTSSSQVARLIGSTTTTSIVGEGLFTITATTSESRNYKKVEVTSEEIVSTQNTARVAFPKDFITDVTYGEEYILKEAQFIYPKDTYNFEGSASLSGSKITVSLEQYNYFIIGRRVTANITGTTSPPITSIDDTITDKKIEYDISNGVSRHVIYIRNNTGISASTPATITNIIQYISSPRDFFITHYTIVSTPPNVARISGTTVTLLKAGTFKIIAHTNQTNPAPTLMNSTKPSPLIRVNKATPVLRFNNLFTCKIQIITGSTYNFNRANITSPNTIPNEILPITYISLNPDIVTIVNGQPTVSERPSLTVKSVGSFRIKAQTPSSDRYNISYVNSPEEISTNLSMPLIKFDPNQNFGPFTYRDAPFTINEVIFRNPIERHEEIEVYYSIPETNVVSLKDRTVTINSAGEFTLRVKTIPSANFTTSNILYKNITIQRYTPQFEEGWVAFINTNNVNYLMIGQTFEINPPTLISPDPIEDTFPSELRSIQYTIEPERRAEIVISETSTGVKVLEEGGFYIYARTTENSKNYNVGVAKSRRIYGSTPERPLIEFPNNNQITEITYGDDYSLDEAVFVYPSPIRNIEGTASLSVTSTETRITLNSLQYSSIIIGAYLRVTTTSDNIFNFIVISTTAQTPVFTVVVGLIAGESPSVGSYTVQNMIQEMRIPVGGSIAYSIVPPPAPILPSYVPVATILGTDVTIKRAGSFIVQAIATITNVPPTFTSSSRPVFSTVNVKRVTPTVSFFDDNLFPNQVLFTGRIYNFTPAVVTIPSSVTYEELEIEYRSEPQGVVTILPSGIKPTTISIQVNKAAPFRIIAQTLEPLSGNFNRSVSVYSSNIHSTEINTPLIFFPDEVAVTNLTYGFTDFGVRNVYNVEQPAEFRYPYIDNIPTDLTINYRISNDGLNIAKVEMKNIIVDSNILGTTTISAPVITILRPGEFTLIAETKAGKFTLTGGTVPTVEFRGSQPIYRKFNVQKATATFEPWYLFPDDPSNPLLAGKRRTFNPPVFRTPIPLLTEFNPSNFTYNSSESRIATVETTFANSVQVLTAVINLVGQFQILASLPETTYYNAICVRSENQYSTNINRPIIRFPREPSPTKVITYGEPYTLSPAYFYYPSPSIVESSRLYITHSIRNSAHFRVEPGTSPNYIETVKISRAGSFRIHAETNVILDKFEKTYIYLDVTVNPATPTISFPGNIFPGQDVLIVGTSYDFLPAVVTVPGITDTTILPQIRYKTNDANIATIKPVVTLEGARIKITILKPSTVPIQIIAYTEATNNFTAARTVYSNQRSSYSNVPLISAPSINGISSTNTLTYGQIPIPTFEKAVLQNPRPNTFFHSSISIEHISSDTKVATIDGTTIKLHKYGTFKIIARTVATGDAIGVFKKNRIDSPLITVNRATPTFNASWNPIPRVMIIDDVATITPPEFTFPAPPVPAEILPITYSYTTAGIITITPAIQPMPPTPPLTTSVRINNIGKFKIKATTEKSDRYESTFFYSPIETTTTRRIPVIEFPPPPPAPPTPPPTTPTFITQVTFGTPYTLREAFFRIPADTRDPATNGVTISYSIIEQVPTNTINVNNVASIIGTNVTIHNVGTFRIEASTTTTGVLFDNAVPIPSPKVTVNPAITSFQPQWNAFLPIAGIIDQNGNAIATDPNPGRGVGVPRGTTININPPQFITPNQEFRSRNGINNDSIEYLVNSVLITGLSFMAQEGTISITARTRINNNFSVATVTSSTLRVFNPIPPRIVIHNVETLVFQETSIPSSPLFITNENPRGRAAGVETFAVVDDRSHQAITNYARGTDTTTFHGVPFNNIVTTLMTNMDILFSGIQNFNEVIASWDTSRVTNMNSMFNGCTNFNQRIERWNTSQVEHMNSMFRGARSFNQNIGNWNTLRVTNMSSMFNNATAFNNGDFQGIGNWNVSNVRNMQFMFLDATAFNSPLDWNTSAVTDMAAMFMRATSFNQSLNLDTRSVRNMNNMFSGATSFRGYGNIFRWDTSQVRTMNGMFQDARVFNQDINRWNTLEVTDMGNMFIAARAYNGAMFSWDTSNVVIMSNMFGQAISFNQPIGRWNTSRVTNMSQMFDGATIFNQPINTLGLLQGESGNEWNTGSVTNMSWMFRGAQQFNQNIGRWNTSQVTDMQSMFQLAQSFNNGLAVEWRFNGFINQDENNRFFIRDIPPFRSISFNNQRRLDTFRSYWIVTTPRQTMNWNTSNVRNMNNMFDEAANFFNVDLRLWRITNDCPTVMFRNFSPMPDQFTPFQVGVAREGAGYT
jgi:surface protein